MSRTIDKARYVRRITTEDIALVMAELHSIVICDPKRGKHVDGDAAGALEAMAELSVAVRVWADAQKKIEKASETPIAVYDPTCIWSEAKAHTFPPVGGSGA